MDAPAIVRGLLAGVIATGAMTLLEVLARSRWGFDSLLDWQENQTMAARLVGRPIEAAVVPGLGFHFLHGAIAGIVFVLILPVFAPAFPLWVLGPGFGIVLFAIGVVIHRPITGRAPWTGRLGRAAVSLSLATHLVYGAALALLIAWP